MKYFIFIFFLTLIQCGVQTPSSLQQVADKAGQKTLFQRDSEGNILPSSKKYLSTKDFRQLFVRKYGIKNAKKSLIITHGVLEHGGRYQNVVNHFAPLGYQIYSYDLRGHGHSCGKRAYVEKFDSYLQDLDQMVNHVIKQNPDQEIYLVGHSMGGLITFLYSLNFEMASNIAGVILSSPALNVDAPIVKNFFGTMLNNRFTGTLTIDTGITSEQLTDDVLEIAKHKSDSLVIPEITIHLAREMLMASYFTPVLWSDWTLPIMMIQAEGDTIVDMTTNTVEFAKLPKKVPQTIINYQNAKHELFNAPQPLRNRVFRDIQHFINTKKKLPELLEENLDVDELTNQAKTIGLNPFTSDECSSFPEGTLKDPKRWSHCCVEHDIAYWVGGTFDERKAADKKLQYCVDSVDLPSTAFSMYWGVRVGGTPHLNTPWKWGYGWDSNRGYQKVTDEEAALARQLFKAHQQVKQSLVTP